jgi:hypothetical protein
MTPDEPAGVTGYYEAWLYAISGELEETCGHQHATLEEAWSCARWFDPDFPFDVVAVGSDGVIVFTCRREDDEDE